MNELHILRDLMLKDLNPQDRLVVDELYMQLATTCSCCHGVDKLALEKIERLKSQYDCGYAANGSSAVVER